MIFGDRIRAALTAEPAAWIAGRCGGAWGTVGSLVPNDYATVLRVYPPDDDPDDWWEAYRRLFGTIATIGARHTSTPGAAWFAVWEGHGFASATRMYVWSEHIDLDDEAAAEIEAERARWLREDERRRAEVRDALSSMPRFDLPDRSHYLLTGGVDAVTELREPGFPERFQRPDLFWPDDRRWFVATDVDFWSLYVGGDRDLVDELARTVDVPTAVVAWDESLEAED